MLADWEEESMKYLSITSYKDGKLLRVDSLDSTAAANRNTPQSIEMGAKEGHIEGRGQRTDRRGKSSASVSSTW